MSSISRTKRSAEASATLANDGKAAASASRWTFLTNHSHVLVLLHSHPELVLREVAQRVGITERAVQRITQDLENDGFIEHKRVGRRNSYRVMTNKSLRHPIESHRKIGDLLALLSICDE